MIGLLTPRPVTHRVLVADDEPDVAAVTRLSLKGLQYGGRPIELLAASTGSGAVEVMRAQPGVSVILLDVVMESDTAGLEACRAIREELGNRFVRILLRTGQPGVVPERAAIDGFDIDGYLPKAELTADRLYASVRTSLKAYEELVELERHRQALALVNEVAASLSCSEPLELMLQRILAGALSLVASPLAVLDLHAYEHQGDPRRWLLHLSTSAEGAGGAIAAARVEAVVAAVSAHLATRPAPEPGPVGGGYLVPFALHRELGYGWLYLDGPADDPLARLTLPLLAGHAANALYSGTAMAMLRDREGPFYEELIV